MEDDAANPLADLLHSRWFWISAAVLAAAVVGLTIAYYARHPDRSLFVDFGKRLPVDLPSTNGHVPGPPAGVGADFLEGEETG